MTRDDLRFKQHAADRMAERGISADDVLAVLTIGEVIEDYPSAKPLPCRLSLGWTGGRPIHVVWSDEAEFVIIITVYEPDADRWQDGFRRRKQR